MMMGPFLFVATILALWTLPANGQQPARSDTLQVTGRGATRWSARNDAIRQALQQKVAQLVIAERAVSLDSVLKDDVASTMNGFVEMVEIITEHRSINETVVQARVVVGTGKIALYISRQRNPQAGTIDGNGLRARLRATQTLERERTDIINRLFIGFPGDALDLKVEEVVLHERNRNKAWLVGRARIDDTFLKQVVAGLNALLASECPSDDCRGQVSVTIDDRNIILAGVEPDRLTGAVSPYEAAFPLSLPTLTSGQDQSYRDYRTVFFTDSAIAFATIQSPYTWDRNLDEAAISRTSRKEDWLALAQREALGCISDHGHYKWYAFSKRWTDERGSGPRVGTDVCLMTGDHLFFASVPVAFLEAAKSIRGMLVPSSVFDECVYQGSNGFKGIFTGTKCISKLKMLTGRTPKYVYWDYPDDGRWPR